MRYAETNYTDNHNRKRAEIFYCEVIQKSDKSKCHCTLQTCTYQRKIIYFSCNYKKHISCKYFTSNLNLLFQNRDLCSFLRSLGSYLRLPIHLHHYLYFPLSKILSANCKALHYDVLVLPRSVKSNFSFQNCLFQFKHIIAFFTKHVPNFFFYSR